MNDAPRVSHIPRSRVVDERPALDSSHDVEVLAQRAELRARAHSSRVRMSRILRFIVGVFTDARLRNERGSR
jgi:hypothetical protein